MTPIPSNREMKEMCKKMRRYIEALKNTHKELEIFVNTTTEASKRQIKILDFQNI